MAQKRKLQSQTFFLQTAIQLLIYQQLGDHLDRSVI